MLLYVDLEKARRHMTANPAQLSMFGGGAPGKPPTPTAHVGHPVPVEVKAHTRHTDDGPVEVPAHIRMVVKVDHPAPASGAPPPNKHDAAVASAAQDAPPPSQQMGPAAEQRRRLYAQNEEAKALIAHPGVKASAKRRLEAESHDPRAIENPYRTSADLRDMGDEFDKLLAPHREHAQKHDAGQQDVAPAAPAAKPVEFADAFEKAFDQLRQVPPARGTNLVSLHALRAEFPNLSREEFDRKLHELRKTGRFLLEIHDGRHAKATPEQIAGSIEESGRRFVYATKRETEDAPEPPKEPTTFGKYTAAQRPNGGWGVTQPGPDGKPSWIDSARSSTREGAIQNAKYHAGQDAARAEIDRRAAAEAEAKKNAKPEPKWPIATVLERIAGAAPELMPDWTRTDKEQGYEWSHGDQRVSMTWDTDANGWRVESNGTPIETDEHPQVAWNAVVRAARGRPLVRTPSGQKWSKADAKRAWQQIDSWHLHNRSGVDARTGDPVLPEKQHVDVAVNGLHGLANLGAERAKNHRDHVLHVRANPSIYGGPEKAEEHAKKFEAYAADDEKGAQATRALADRIDREGLPPKPDTIAKVSDKFVPMDIEVARLAAKAEGFQVEGKAYKGPNGSILVRSSGRGKPWLRMLPRSDTAGHYVSAYDSREAAAKGR